MNVSPRKYASIFTNSTVNRGVEAKVKEATTGIRNTKEMSTSMSSQSRISAGAVEARGTGEAAREEQPVHDDTGSYLQVLVEKHRRRVPASSSPHPPPRPHGDPHPDPGSTAKNIQQVWVMGGAGEAVLLAPVQLQHCLTYPGAPAGHSSDVIAEAKKKQNVANGDFAETDKQQSKQSVWKRWSQEQLYTYDGPEQIEVYYFERSSGEYLCAGGGVCAGREGTLARCSRRFEHSLVSYVDEMLAIPRLIVSAPIAIVLRVYRCLLSLCRDAVVGCVQNSSDYALKPILALLHNALLQPPLVLVGNVLRATRTAVRPVTDVLADATEPVARILRAFRLVEIQRCDKCKMEVL